MTTKSPNNESSSSSMTHVEEQMKMLGLELEMVEDTNDLPENDNDDDDDDQHDQQQPFIIVQRAAQKTVAAVGRVTARNNFSTKKVLLLAILSTASLLFIRVMTREMEVADVMEDVELRSGGGGGVGGFHENSFGGKIVTMGGGSIAEDDIAVDSRRDDDNDDATVTNDVVSDTTLSSSSFERRRRSHRTSVHALNRVNSIGHYWHDELRSPHANDLYAGVDYAVLEEYQHLFLERMDEVRDVYGAWDFSDEGGLVGTKDEYDDAQEPLPRPIVEVFEDYDGRDVPVEEFPEGVWQGDEVYVRSFLGEAVRLVERVQEGIYAEYGFGKGSGVSEVRRRRQIDEIFGVTVGEEGSEGVSGDDGVAWMSREGYDLLVRKILHAMITNDDFFVVEAGDDLWEGEGENFHMQKVMQFHYIMEPVFDKLGMNLISRVMPGGMEMLMAGNGIIGEKDVLLWESSNTNSDHGWIWRQVFLSGERLPVILPQMGSLSQQQDVFPLTTGASQAMTLPYATRFVKCSNETQELCDAHKYVSQCWINRTDVTPETTQKNHPRFDESQPGFRTLRWESRKLALLILHATKSALQIWKSKTSPKQNSKYDHNDTFTTPQSQHPLNDEYWHMSSYQTQLRAQLQSKQPCTGPTVLPQLCHVTLTGATEYTPRADPDGASLRQIVKAAPPNGYKPHLRYDQQNLYNGPDLLFERIPEGEVDVHAIAIATKTKSLPVGNKRRMKMLRQRRDLKDDDDSFTSKRNVTKATNTNQTTTITKEELLPGTGWTLNGIGGRFCDGSAQSECQRSPHNSHCLLSHHHFGQGQLVGDHTSGWLVLQLTNVKEGIVLARMEEVAADALVSDSNDATEKDLSESGKREYSAIHLSTEEDDFERRLKKKQKDKKQNTKKELPSFQQKGKLFPSYYQLQIAVNGVITKTYNNTELEFQKIQYTQTTTGVPPLYVLLNDKNHFSKRRQQQQQRQRDQFEDDDSDDRENTTEIAIRVLLRGRRKNAGLAISHVYWA